MPSTSKLLSALGCKVRLGMFLFSYKSSIKVGNIRRLSHMAVSMYRLGFLLIGVDNVDFFFLQWRKVRRLSYKGWGFSYTSVREAICSRRTSHESKLVDRWTPFPSAGGRNLLCV
jgi:hypothetical protein